MARQKAITDEELLKYISEYHLQNPTRKLEIPKIGEYIRSKGKNIADYIIRRNPKARELIDSYNDKDETEMNARVVAYHQLDADQFIRKNPSREKLVEAITKRDAYYAQIASYAASAISQKKKYEETNQKLKAENDQLKAQMSKLVEKADKKESRKKDEIIRKLKHIIYDSVYPDIANALLEQEGILNVVEQITNPAVLKENVIKADEPIQPEVEDKKDTIDKLLEDFND